MTEKQAGEWIPLMEYSMKKGVSLSTLRRHIKANKVEYRVENGRYLLFDDSEDDARMSVPPPRPQLTDSSALHMRARGTSALAQSVAPTALDEAAQLRRELQMAREEIAELKMLVDLYEEKLSVQRIDN